MSADSWTLGINRIRHVDAVDASWPLREGDYISSLRWGSDGNFLAVGTSDAKVQIWDASRWVHMLGGQPNGYFSSFFVPAHANLHCRQRRGCNDYSPRTLNCIIQVILW